MCADWVWSSMEWCVFCTVFCKCDDEIMTDVSACSPHSINTVLILIPALSDYPEPSEASGPVGPTVSLGL